MKTNTLDIVLLPNTDRICARVIEMMKGSFWDQIKKTEWTNRLSGVERIFTFERPLPANMDTWSGVGYEPDRNPSTGNIVRTYGLVQRAVESDKLGINDPISKIEEVISDHIRNLAYVLHRRSVTEYSRLADTKSIAGVGVTYGEVFPPIMPTEKFSTKGVNLGGFPIYPEMVISTCLSPECFNGRYMPRRWALKDEKWIEIEPFESDGKTPSKAYELAEVEDTVLYSPDVMEICIPKARDKQDEPFENSTVDSRWKNVICTDPESYYYNPDGAIGFYRTLIVTATKPCRPESGVVIRHLR